MLTKYVPARKAIGDILSMTSPPVVVPDWQRNYSWTTSEIETFWEDLIRFSNNYPGNNIDDQEYFLGAIVIVNTHEGHLLLDGQQRIATSAILISVIRDFLARYSADASQRISTRYLTDFDDALERKTYKITLNRFDRDFFKREILESKENRDVPLAPTCGSHHLIRKAKLFIKKKFEEQFQKFPSGKDANKWVLRMHLVIVKHVSVVAVITDDEDNASNVFETLNDRGIGLSTPDLLRNLVLRRANNEQLDEVLNSWSEVLKIEGDAKLRDFFRHFWLSREGDVKSRSLYREIKAKILNENIDSLEFSRDLRSSSGIYQDILAANFDEDDTISKQLDDINKLGAKVLYPPTLSLLETAKSPEIIRKFLRCFIVAYVRHSLIGRKENSLIENVMFLLAQKIRENVSDQLLLHLSDFAPNDEQFLNNFASVSITRRASVSYLLREIEQRLRTTEELMVAPPSKVHVEHIYPQTPSSENRLPQHDAYINRLGNLTLLSAKLNSKIKNGTYSEKKESFGKSEIRITKIIPSEYIDWNVDSIEKRQRILAEIALEIWSFDI